MKRNFIIMFPQKNFKKSVLSVGTKVRFVFVRKKEQKINNGIDVLWHP